MRLFDGTGVIIGVILIAGLIGLLSSQFLGDDNPVEETAEMIIEHHTGLDFDLTPDSYETTPF